jgi:hypothetical protein
MRGLAPERRALAVLALENVKAEPVDGAVEFLIREGR